MEKRGVISVWSINAGDGEVNVIDGNADDYVSSVGVSDGSVVN